MTSFDDCRNTKKNRTFCINAYEFVSTNNVVVATSEKSDYLSLLRSKHTPRLVHLTSSSLSLFSLLSQVNTMIRVGNDAYDASSASLGMSRRTMRPVLLHNGGATSTRNIKSHIGATKPIVSPVKSSPSPLEAPLDDALNRSQVSYYASDIKFGQLRDCDDGEVPEVYRHCSHIELAISCTNLQGGRRVSYHVTVDVGNLGLAWQTEQVCRTSSPSFVARGKLCAFSMEGSQTLARASWVRVAVWDKRRNLVGTADCRLSDVLWHRVIDVELRHPEDGQLPSCEVPVGSNGLVSIAAIPCDSPGRFRHAVVTLEVCDNSDSIGRDVRSHLVLMRNMPRGRWCPLAKMDGFGQIRIPLPELMQGTLRLCVLRARRKGEYATIVMAQFSLAQLVRAAKKHGWLPRLRSSNDEGDVMLRAEKWLQDDEIAFYARVAIVKASVGVVREVVDFGVFDKLQIE